MGSNIESERLLTGLLRDVSRSFYLTLRILPPGVRAPVGLAYLLARAADTLADTRVLAPSQRLARLQALRARLRGEGAAEDAAALAQVPGAASAAERRLLAALPRALTELDALPAADAARVRRVLGTLTGGMEWDLGHFPPEDAGRIGAAPDAAALDAYCHAVAGCVGEFWTQTCMAHTPALRSWDEARQAQLGVRFGKALQLTNILRDLPRDLRIGRCYLPLDGLRALGLEPADLLDPARSEAARPLLVRWIRVALEHYRAAGDYTLAIPRRCLRLRLAALWPLLIGLATLAELARAPAWLDARTTIKIPRARVYRLVAASLPLAASNALLGLWLASLRRRVERAL